MTGRGCESTILNDETENGSYSYGRQQSRIFDNGRKPDRATPRAGRRPSGCKLLLRGKNPAPFWFGMIQCAYVLCLCSV